MHLTTRTALLLAAMATTGQAAMGTASADDLKALGTTLTPWGAEKAGNKDGTIPAYTGGLTTPPAGHDPKRPGWLVDPFSNEKPLYRIDATNYEKYADKLTPATLELLKRYPTFFVNVYPTHRTAAYPQSFLDSAVKNAGGRCALINDNTGLDVAKGCSGGVPFPVPSSGLEAMWNHNFRYVGPAFVFRYRGQYVKPSGEVVVTSDAKVQMDYPLQDPAGRKSDHFFIQRTETLAPARTAGQAILTKDRTADSERTSHMYQPATRRVRLAPDLAADTPIGGFGGAVLYDEANMYQGSGARFEWKLLGKKEVFIPYNSYKMAYSPEGSGCGIKEQLTPRHPKADCMRWELHRVWHVQATLKAGARHVYSKRDFYYDEDTWYAGAQENYDQSGKLHRVILMGVTPDYVNKAPAIEFGVSLDLNSGIYFMAEYPDGRLQAKPLTDTALSPDSLNAPVLRY